MKHARKDYDRIQDPNGLIPKDEPVFLLRGQDKLAPALLLEWSKQLRLQGGSPVMAELVEKHAQDMIAWQATVKGKQPDLPYELEKDLLNT